MECNVVVLVGTVPLDKPDHAHNLTAAPHLTQNFGRFGVLRILAPLLYLLNFFLLYL